MTKFPFVESGNESAGGHDDAEVLCRLFKEAMNAYLADQCREKTRAMEQAGEGHYEGCPCEEGHCSAVLVPAIHPCISIRWGDSKCDCMEGDDHEALCVTVSNCYSNVTFSNFRIGYLIVVDANGNLAPSLPDGSPSSWIYPTGPICFGDVGLCVDGKPGSVSRDAVIINRGLPPGKWFVRVGMVCFDVTLHYAVAEQSFAFDVCKN